MHGIKLGHKKPWEHLGFFVWFLPKESRMFFCDFVVLLMESTSFYTKKKIFKESLNWGDSTPQLQSSDKFTQMGDHLKLHAVKDQQCTKTPEKTPLAFWSKCGHFWRCQAHCETSASPQKKVTGLDIQNLPNTLFVHVWTLKHLVGLGF